MDPNKYLSKRWALLLLLLVWFGFFFPIILRQKVLFFGDTTTQRVPSMILWKLAVESHQLPLWNPYIFVGVPFLADLSNNTLSPFNVFYLLVANPYQALSLLAVTEIFMTAWFTYSFLSNQKLSVAAACVGAITFAFSGTILAAMNDINSLQGIIFIPAILWLASRLIKAITIPNIIWLAVGLGVQFVSGHPQYAYFTWILCGCYLFCFLDFLALSKRCALIIVVFGLFFGLVAVQLLPFLELSEYTYRPKKLDFSTTNSLEVLDLPRLVLGNFYGSWISGVSWGPRAPLELGRAGSEGFVGVMSLLLAVTAMIKSKNRQKNFFAVMVITTLILSLGSTTPFFKLVWNLLPLADKFRSPIRFLAFYTLGVAVLASYGSEYLIKKAKTVAWTPTRVGGLKKQ